MAKYVKVIRVHESETVEIQWTLANGTTYIDRHTVPPKETRQARRVDGEDSAK